MTDIKQMESEIKLLEEQGLVVNYGVGDGGDLDRRCVVIPYAYILSENKIERVSVLNLPTDVKLAIDSLNYED